MSDSPTKTTPGVEVDLVTYVCPRCGKKFEREETVHTDPKETSKLLGTIGFAAAFLIGVWIWVFTFGVPLVKSITKD